MSLSAGFRVAKLVVLARRRVLAVRSSGENNEIQ